MTFISCSHLDQDALEEDILYFNGGFLVKEKKRKCRLGYYRQGGEAGRWTWLLSSDQVSLCKTHLLSAFYFKHTNSICSNYDHG